MRSDNMPREADIVERLLALEPREANEVSEVLVAAADEIARLQLAVSQLRDLVEVLERSREGLKTAHAGLACLRAKIEGAPVEEVYNAGSEKNWYIVHAPEELNGKRVRLVVCDD